MGEKYKNDNVDGACNVLMKHAFTLAESLVTRQYPGLPEERRVKIAEDLAFKTLANLLTPAATESKAPAECRPVFH